MALTRHCVGADAEPLAEPPRERARRGEAEQLRDVGQRVAVVRQVALGQAARVACTIAEKLCPSAASWRCRVRWVTPRLRATWRVEQRPSGSSISTSSPDLVGHRRPARCGIDAEELLGVGPEQGVGHRVRGIELVGEEDQPGERVVELQPRPEDRRGRRRASAGCGWEKHTDSGSHCAAEQLADDPVQRGRGQLQ